MKLSTSAFAASVLALGLASISGAALAQDVNCTVLIEGAAGIAVRSPAGGGDLRRSPDYPRARRQAQRDAPVKWSEIVARNCPGYDPRWSRARKKTTQCGFLSSSQRYSCVLTGIPARKRR